VQIGAEALAQSSFSPHLALGCMGKNYFGNPVDNPDFGDPSLSLCQPDFGCLLADC
jgi:hypothetical protein